MPKFKGLILLKLSLAGDVLQFKRFGWLRNLMKNGCPNGPKKSSTSSHWAPMVEFLPEWAQAQGSLLVLAIPLGPYSGDPPRLGRRIYFSSLIMLWARDGPGALEKAVSTKVDSLNT